LGLCYLFPAFFNHLGRTPLSSSSFLSPLHPTHNCIITNNSYPFHFLSHTCSISCHARSTSYIFFAYTLNSSYIASVVVLALTLFSVKIIGYTSFYIVHRINIQITNKKNLEYLLPLLTSHLEQCGNRSNKHEPELTMMFPFRLRKGLLACPSTCLPCCITLTVFI